MNKNFYNSENVDHRYNFLNTDRTVAINSYGEVFKIGAVVGNEDTMTIQPGESAVIQSFQIDKKTEEVKAFTSNGWAHIDFIYNLGHSESEEAEVAAQGMDMNDNNNECGLYSTLGVECIREERVTMGPFIAYDKLSEHKNKTIVDLDKIAEPVREKLAKLTMLSETLNYEGYIKALSIFGAILATEIEKASIAMDKFKSDKNEGDQNNEQ